MDNNAAMAEAMAEIRARLKRAPRPAILLILASFATAYFVGNGGGNYLGWMEIYDLLEAMNGARTLSPELYSLPVLGLWIFLPSIGQLLLQLAGRVVRRVKMIAWPLYGLIAADLAINAIGFYSLVMPFRPPVNPFLFVFEVVLAAVPNILCQGVATFLLFDILLAPDDTSSQPAVVKTEPPKKSKEGKDKGQKKEKERGEPPPAPEPVAAPRLYSRFMGGKAAGDEGQSEIEELTMPPNGIA